MARPRAEDAPPSGSRGSPFEGGSASTSKVEKLFREHNEMLLRFLKARLGSDADARDAAQEAYVRLLQLDEPDQPSFLRAYLYRIAANVATDALRRRRMRGASVVEEPSDAPDPAMQERALAARQQLGIVEAALGELPPRCREAFLLSRDEGWSSAQIAVRLGVSDRMVRMYLARALEHVQSALARAESESVKR
jgi:RNA polymerase sigma-70 factor (ECF subfamily)